MKEILITIGFFVLWAIWLWYQMGKLKDDDE